MIKDIQKQLDKLKELIQEENHTKEEIVKITNHYAEELHNLIKDFANREVNHIYFLEMVNSIYARCGRDILDNLIEVDLDALFKERLELLNNSKELLNE